MSRKTLRSALLAAALCHPAAALALPDGDGREMVEGVCAACHGVNLIERSSGYSRDDWQFLAATMIDLSGDSELEAKILDYLADHFPRFCRKPALAGGLTTHLVLTPPLAERRLAEIQHP